MKNTREHRCVCGALYRAMSTGLTFAAVRAMMRDVPDPNREGWYRQKTRRSVLGFWHEMKVHQWESIHGGCVAAVEDRATIRTCVAVQHGSPPSSRSAVRGQSSTRCSVSGFRWRPSARSRALIERVSNARRSSAR